MTQHPKANNRIQHLQRINDRGGNRKGKCRLDKNERTIPFPDDTLNAILKKVCADSLSIYPDQNPLYAKLSNHLKLSEKQILLTAGGDAAIKTIFETYVEPGDHVAYLWPTYAMVDIYAKMFGAKITKFNYDAQLKISHSEIIDTINQGLKLIFLANPNQPSGTTLDDAALDEILSLCKKRGTIIILDQVYIDFSKIKQRNVEINDNPYLFIVRSFSKSYGLAGLRLGYILTDENNINQLYKVKPLSDINAIALAAGEYLLDNPQITHDYIANVQQSKQMLSEYFDSISMEVINSETNFIHIKPGKHINKIYQGLMNNNYLIRQTGEGLPAVIQDCLRITVGPPEQMKTFIENIQQIIT